LRREGKKKKNVGVFLEEEEEWESVMKWEILIFLVGYFTDSFTNE
jgi:hypothetical protein